MRIPLILAQAAPPADPVAPAVDLRGQALELFRTLSFGQMERAHWVSLGEYYGMRALFVIVLMVLAWTISTWFSEMVRKGLTRVKFDQTLTLFISRLVRWGILLLTALTCLSSCGIETTSFAAVIGAAGLAVGLAFQGTLSNFAAGAMLLVFRPYKVGDTIVSGSHQGTVAEIALFTTEIDTADGRRIIIPNSSMNNSVIENTSYNRIRRTDVPVAVAYDADIDATRRALERALISMPQALREPAPAVVLVGLTDSAVNWTVQAWALQKDLGQMRQALIRAVKMELDQAGIGMPRPHTAVELLRVRKP